MRERFLIELCVNSPSAVLSLLKAYEYAFDLGRSELDFIVRIRSLMLAGLSECDLRWLIGKQLLTHVVVMTDPCRQFVIGDGAHFAEGSGFALTNLGYEQFNQFIRLVPLRETEAVSASTPCQKSCDTASDQDAAPPVNEVNNHNEDAPPRNGNGHVSHESTSNLRPSWCDHRKELRLNGSVVKRFKVPSPNQVTVLTVFEEEGWPIRIDDPLPASQESVRKRRLQDTIKSLNRNQEKELIRFRGDGSGEGVLWETPELP